LRISSAKMIRNRRH